MAILYRTNAQSRVLEEMLMRSAIPYKVFGGQKFYDRKEVRDVIAYLRVVVNPADDVSLRRIINVPKRAIGDSTVQELMNHAQQNNMPLYSALSDVPDSLSARPKKCVSDFFMLMTMLLALKETMPLEEFVSTLVEKRACWRSTRRKIPRKPARAWRTFRNSWVRSANTRKQRKTRRSKTTWKTCRW